MRDVEYFPATYDESRARFLKRARELGAGEPGARARLTSFQVPSRRSEDLHVDALYLPPEREMHHLVVIVSGVHGMEAYAGAAVQEMFCEEILPAFPRERVGVLLVHAMNPFGFKYHRRVTENNVNLNRNFGVNAEMFSHRNRGYQKLVPVLEPEGPTGEPKLAFLGMTTSLLARLARRQFTINDLIESIAQGQFERAQGLEYGGQDFEPQSVFLRELLRALVPEYRDILLLDLHTGLGERYQLHLMPGSRKGAVDPELFSELFDPERDRDVYAYTTGDTDGFYHTHGDLNNLIPDLLKPSQRALAFTLEFGTLGNGSWPKLQTLNRMINENRGFHHGFRSERVRNEVEREFLELFCPTEIQWRANVVEHGRQFFKRLGQGLEGRASGVAPVLKA